MLTEEREGQECVQRSSTDLVNSSSNLVEETTGRLVSLRSGRMSAPSAGSTEGIAESHFKPPEGWNPLTLTRRFPGISGLVVGPGFPNH
jgi:hypothetical protein